MKVSTHPACKTTCQAVGQVEISSPEYVYNLFLNVAILKVDSTYSYGPSLSAFQSPGIVLT